MRLANAFKYQMTSAVKAIGIYYGIMLLIRMAMLLADIYLISNGNSHISAVETNTMVFMLFLGVFSIVEDFKFFVQNGYSRKSLIKLYIIQFAACALILACLDVTCSYVLDWMYTYESLCDQIYGAQFFLLEILWLMMVNMAIGVLAFFFTILVQRMNKFQRIVYLLGVPVVLVTMLPVLDIYVLDGAMSSYILEFLTKAMGLYQNTNMIIPIFSFMAVSAIFSILSYLAIRRATPFVQS